jgi:translation initiation factor IF-2
VRVFPVTGIDSRVICAQAQEEARKSMVEVEYYNVIYDLLDKTEWRLKQILSPTPEGDLVGAALVKQVCERWAV